MIDIDSLFYLTYGYLISFCLVWFPIFDVIWYYSICFSFVLYFFCIFSYKSISLLVSTTSIITAVYQHNFRTSNRSIPKPNLINSFPPNLHILLSQLNARSAIRRPGQTYFGARRMEDAIPGIVRVIHTLSRVGKKHTSLRHDFQSTLDVSDIQLTAVGNHSIYYMYNRHWPFRLRWVHWTDRCSNYEREGGIFNGN